jgi:hypothetical protein
VSEETPPPIPYQVIYSASARSALIDIAVRANQVGRGAEYAAVVAEMEQWLRIYPQFGEPIIDLKTDVGQILIAAFAPLMIRYAISETRRHVYVAAPPRLLPRSGIV